jgi:hypothetical protein
MKSTSHPVLLGMGNVSDKSCRENQNIFYVEECFLENGAIMR